MLSGQFGKLMWNYYEMQNSVQLVGAAGWHVMIVASAELQAVSFAYSYIVPLF